MPKKKKTEYEVRASLTRRLMAFIIDLLVIDIVIVQPFRKLLYSMMPSSDFQEMQAFLSSSASAAYGIFAVITAISVLAILYFSISEYRLGQTLGKMMMNLRVVSSSKKLSLWRCLLRNIFFLPVFPFILLWIIEPLAIIFTKENVRSLEMITGTKTVELIPYREEHGGLI